MPEPCDAARLPTFPEGFRRANAGLQPHASLEDLIGFVRKEAVASYDHADGTLHEQASDFVHWLWQQYQHHMQERSQP